MLRKIRITLAIIFFCATTLLFLDVTGLLHLYLGWLAKVQLLPAILALNVGVVAAILLVTLLFGRVYCSVICPLGVMQDCFSWLGGRVKKNRFHYTKASNVLRYGVLVVFVVLMVVGLGALASIIAPYSAFGRIVTTLFQPLYIWLNNLLASISAHFDSYAFYGVETYAKGALAITVSALLFVIVGFLSFRYGRLWCNTVCPVGSLLGLVSRFSLFRPVFDVEKCNACTRCARNCKCSCIDPDRHEIDASRCVACMDCIVNCKQGAIRFALRKKAVKSSELAVDSSRRKFLATTALVSASAAIASKAQAVDGGLAVIEEKKVPRRKTPLKPFGSQGQKHFATHCTSCQLCVSECPSHVLRPSKSITSLLQPEMSYEKGYCRPDCTRCSQVCPSGAIRPISPNEKTSISIGFAVTVLENCVAYRDGVNCGTCARHCPAGAIRMVEKGSVRIPSVDENRCLGCGACEYYCPSRPFSAIYVEGRTQPIMNR